MHEKSSLVVVSFATKLTLRMSFRTILIPFSKMALVIYLLVNLLLRWKGLFVIDAELTHMKIVLRLIMLLKLFHVTSSLLAYSTFERPQSFNFRLVICFREKHLRFLVVYVIWANVVAPNSKIRKLSTNSGRTDNMIKLLFTRCTTECPLNRPQS